MKNKINHFGTKTLLPRTGIHLVITFETIGTINNYRTQSWKTHDEFSIIVRHYHENNILCFRMPSKSKQKLIFLHVMVSNRKLFCHSIKITNQLTDVNVRIWDLYGNCGEMRRGIDKSKEPINCDSLTEKIARYRWLQISNQDTFSDWIVDHLVEDLYSSK